jgi:hypothetical protein
LKEILPEKSQLSSWRNAHFVSNRPIHLTEETSVSLGIKPSVSEAGIAST